MLASAGGGIKMPRPDAYIKPIRLTLKRSSSGGMARRFWDAMRTRFEQFGLELHGEKTRLLEFGRHAAERNLPKLRVLIGPLKAISNKT